LGKSGITRAPVAWTLFVNCCKQAITLIEKLAEPDRPISVFPLEDVALFRNSTEKEVGKFPVVGYFDSGFRGFTKNASIPNRARERIASHHG